VLKPKLTGDGICAQLLFESNRSTLTAESKNIIDRKLGPWLRIFPSAAKSGFIADGWSDSIGSDDVCQKVSLARAESVARYLDARLGCNATPAGRGKSFNPPNTSEENKQQNRRVDLRIAVAAGSNPLPHVTKRKTR